MAVLDVILDRIGMKLDRTGEIQEAADLAVCIAGNGFQFSITVPKGATAELTTPWAHSDRIFPSLYLVSALLPHSSSFPLYFSYILFPL